MPLILLKILVFFHIFPQSMALKQLNLHIYESHKVSTHQNKVTPAYQIVDEIRKIKNKKTLEERLQTELWQQKPSTLVLRRIIAHPEFDSQMFDSLSDFEKRIQPRPIQFILKHAREIKTNYQNTKNQQFIEKHEQKDLDEDLKFSAQKIALRYGYNNNAEHNILIDQLYKKNRTAIKFNNRQPIPLSTSINREDSLSNNMINSLGKITMQYALERETIARLADFYPAESSLQDLNSYMKKCERKYPDLFDPVTYEDDTEKIRKKAQKLLNKKKKFFNTNNKVAQIYWKLHRFTVIWNKNHLNNQKNPALILDGDLLVSPRNIY
ncbi:MAG: hypothetical protein WA432_03530 [Candidatus Babeliaceae bacterium]